MAMVEEIDHRHFLPNDAGSITKRIDRLNGSKSQNGGYRNSHNQYMVIESLTAGVL